MVQEREDIVLLDSAIILHPQVWVASGHVGGFSDPLVDCRTCKLRFRADHLDTAACGRRPSKHPGETPDCDLTEARQFNLMFETSIGPVRDEGSRRLSPARDGAGHLRQLQERHVLAARQAAVRHRADRQELPQRDHARELPLPHARVRADGDGVLRAARGVAAVVRVLDRRAPPLVSRARPAREPPPRAGARRRRALPLLERHERPRVPLPDRLVGARGHREPRRLRPQRSRIELRARSSSGSATRSATSRM